MHDKKTLENLRKQLQFKDTGIFEKTVYAISLLQEVSQLYPELIFKGGTCVLLHIFPPVRFSIDIDILLHEKERENLSINLQKMVSSSPSFLSFEEDKRKSPIPKLHFKFYYDSHFSQSQQYVLLDIVFCESPYHNHINKSLKGHPLDFNNIGGMVKIPTIEALCGDKMTAVAPKTTGIALDSRKEMEFVKQVVDIGLLFDNMQTIKGVREAFINTIKQENGFRETNYSKEDVIEDIRSVAFKYSQYLLRGGNDSFKEIVCINSGLRRVRNHLFSSYTNDDLKLSFAKLIYLCNMIQDEKQNTITKTVNYDLLKGKTLPDRYEILGGLKKTNPQAYFYWVLALEE